MVRRALLIALGFHFGAIALVSAVSIQNTRNDLTNLGVTNIQQRSTSTASAIDAYLQSRLGDIILVGKLPDIVRFGQKYGYKNVMAAIQNRTPKRFSREKPLSEWVEDQREHEPAG